MTEAYDPISDDELLYRRISTNKQLNYYNPDIDPNPSPKAFRPNHKFDLTGLSLYRAKYIRPQQVAENDREAKYFIAVLRAGDVRALGAIIEPCPDENKPGHVEITNLRSDNRRDTDELQFNLAESCLEVLGPFSMTVHR